MSKKRFVATTVEVEGRSERRIVEVPAFEPEPWTQDTPLDVVGQCVPRMDALEKVTGRAIYSADVTRTGMLHAAIVRSTVAHGVVREINASGALSIPGVRGVLLRSAVDGIKYDGGQLFDPTIRYVGQPVMAVCAESREISERAARAVVVTADPLPHAVTIEAALAKNAPKVRKHGNIGKDNPRVEQRGDVDKAIASAAVVVRREYRTPVQLHTCMEPHGAVADWSGDKLTVWESTQGIFNTRNDLAKAFGLPQSQVRVIKDYMGGGFGAKNGASVAAYIASALSRQTGEPVRCVFDREGEQVDTGNRSSTIQRVTLAAKKDGTLTAIVMEGEIMMGVGGWFAGPAGIYHELYQCPNVRTSETAVYTHTGAMASFRAPGHVEGAFALECAMNVLARELAMDPLALRLKNISKKDQQKSRPYSDKQLAACYDLGAKRFGWKAPVAGSPPRSGAEYVPAAQRAAAENAVSRFRRGRGMSSLCWGAGGGPPAYATVRLNPDGTVEVLTGTQDLGTGARTVLAQIAAEALGADIATVRTVLGDTETLPYTGNSWGSMTTASVGPAVRMAAEDAKTKLLDAASALMGVPSIDLECHNSIVRAVGSPKPKAESRELSFAAVGEELGNVMILGHGSRGPNPDDTAIYAFGAQFAEVEVDIETGRVRVTRFVAAHDSGRIINPRLAESQLEGGILQGLGYALFEERVQDEASGVPLNASMHDYKIPTLSDLPKIEAFFVPASDTVANHTGAKGLAEPPIIGVAPAIANAVANALGVEITEIPLTPWRVLDALRVSTT
ncbi:MAG TPA: xanthine dehydrogenase family protein molybdopterin-binding subunit [Gemmatimonadaceae bacterium]